MALTTTTLSSALGATDISMVVASATGFAANTFWQIDGETVLVAKNYASGTTIPILRGQNGTVAAAHVSSANVVGGAATEFSNPVYGGATTTQQVMWGRTVRSYVASGAITLPTPGSDMVAILIGTSALAMTVAAPTKDMDGCRLVIQGNAKSASTITVTNGIGNAGSSYDVVTLQNAGNVGIELIAVNAFWNINAAPAITGTTTAIGAAIA